MEYLKVIRTTDMTTVYSFPYNNMVTNVTSYLLVMEKINDLLRFYPLDKLMFSLPTSYSLVGISTALVLLGNDLQFK